MQKDLVEYLIKLCGTSQADVAEAFGMSTALLNSYLRGKNTIPQWRLIQIARHPNVGWVKLGALLEKDISPEKLSAIKATYVQPKNRVTKSVKRV